MNEQLELVKLIAYRLESNGIAYMLTGSMAVAIYAAPMMTRDIDLVIPGVWRLLAQLRKE